MATTTNYSWTTPDDTALVKDGAAAIRSLGTAIDSTVFSNASAAVAKTIVDAKGDIIAATAADTVSRLAVGTNGQVLKANSATATGLEWGSASASFVGCRLSKTSAQTISNATFTAITYDAETFDTNTFHDNSTNTSRITIPAGYGGYYEVFGICSFNQNGTGQRNFEIRKNGTLYNSYVMSAGSAAISAAVFSEVINVAAADYIELYVYQSSGGNLNTTSNGGDPGSHVFGVAYLGA